MTQAELAEKAKLSVKIIRLLETGGRPSFDEDTLIRVGRVFDLTLEDLLNPPAPEVTFITETDGKQLSLFEASLECFESLFPDHVLRDPPEDIIM